MCTVKFTNKAIPKPVTANEVQLLLFLAIFILKIPLFKKVYFTQKKKSVSYALGASNSFQ